MSVLSSTAVEAIKAVGLLPRDCASCPLFKPCGGHQLEIIRTIGCASFADDGLPADRNDMNPLDEERYWRLWDDVDGLLDFSISTIKAVHSLDVPLYVPLLQHKYSRTATLSAPVVALHLYQIFRKSRDGHYLSRFADGAQLRAYYRLRPDAKIILSGVAIDRRLELFWAHHRKDGVAAQLAKLGVSCVTVPNFSFFTDSTRYQILRNRKRMVLVTERLSEAGVPVAPHLNAITDRDWEFCEDLLRDHPATSVVTLEFQTGLATVAEGRGALARVADMQQKLGRLLHPILVGGAKHYVDAQVLFSRFTVIDSRPFMEAQARRTLVGDNTNGYRWTKTGTADGLPIDAILEANLVAYPEKLKLPSKQDEAAESDTAQMELFDSRPYLTAQPVA
jgi:hypothetical protein